jgi:predicted Rossmann-fold nucleotide-binding protein
MTSGKLFVPRRVGVCGSSQGLPLAAVPFCVAIGRELAKQENVVIVSGGARRRAGPNQDDLAADWHIVNAAEQEIRRRSGPDAVDQRIETVVTGDPSMAPPNSAKDEKFHIGTLRRARGKTREARRISFVKSLDGLVAIAGRGGTAQELALAMELAAAVLPVPLFEGAAKEFWQSYEADLLQMLHIDEATASRWRAPVPADEAGLGQLAVSMVAALLKALPRRCFVIMPFNEDFETLYDFVIERAVAAVGDSPIRLDRTAIPGDTTHQIHDGIKVCDYAIAVLDGFRPNVLYELGLAHAYGKPTILLNRNDAVDSAVVAPFDVSTHQRQEYSGLAASLVDRLKNAILSLRPGQRS